MTSPDWNEIAEKYTVKDLEAATSDYSKYFGKDAKNNLHNDVFNSLQRKGKKGDLHRYALVKHYADLLPGIQKKLLEEGKVIKYSYNGKEIYRSNSPKWKDTEIEQLRQITSRKDVPQVAKALGRSQRSVYDKWREDEIKRGVWKFRKAS